MREDAEGGKPSNKRHKKQTGKQGHNGRTGRNRLELRLLDLYMKDAITAENFIAATGDLKAARDGLSDAEQKVLHLIRISN
jgi:hypothetical protein